MNIDSSNKYTQMQLKQYNSLAKQWTEENRDHVVGSFDLHNTWPDYEILFERINDINSKIALDFACGPGRNLVKYKNLFKQLDGVDISPDNIEKAKLYCLKNNINNQLYVNNGVDLNCINSEQYDVVMSTIALQHICVYDIRKSLFKEFNRVLKPGGILTAQMGYGSPSPKSVGYYENYYDAKDTNRGCDVCIETYKQLEDDLVEIGFSDFQYKIRPVGPGDCHPNWIFFSAVK
jgi:ubiquinone/menaquinone biosynthesis C-methylase UbiE